MRAEPSIDQAPEVAPDPGRPEFLQGLLDSLRDGVVALDSGSRIIEWNKGAANIFGFNRDEVLGRPLDALIAGPRKREAAGLTARVMRQGREVADFETVRYAKDGTAVEVGISVSPIEAGGEVRGSVGIYKDITAWKNRESRLKHTSRLLRAIGEINQLIIRAEDAEDLLRSARGILDSTGGYRQVTAVTLTPEGRPARMFGRSAGSWSGRLRPCASRALENRRSLFIPNTAKASWCRTCEFRKKGWAACFLLGSQDRLYGLLHISNPSAAFDLAREIIFLEETAGNLGHALHGLRERKDRERISEELRTLKEFNENIVRGLAEGIVIENARGMITFVNPTIERLLGFDPGEILGRPWRTIVAPAEIHKIKAKIKVRPTATLEKYESVLKAKDGRLVPVLVGAQSLFDKRRFKGVLTAVTDIRELKDFEHRLLESQKQLTELATKDGLTGQWNRTTILKFLADEIARGGRERLPTSVIMIDVDYFKKINDAFGHLAGDRVLRTMTGCLRKHLRPYDKIGRYGGDEVLLVLPHCDLAKASVIAERLRSACAKTILRIPGRAIRFTLSVGCASSQSFARPTIDRLIRAADQALYRAKKDGRNRVAVATPGRTPRRGGAPSPPSPHLS